MTRQPNTLTQLFAEHSGKVSDKWSIYISEYDRLFQPYRDQPVRLLEIGIQNGGSLEIWGKFFTNGVKFVGCDINPDCAKLQFDDPRITVVVSDANTDDAWRRILHGSPEFDLIIDDGSHQSGDIVRSFANYFTLLSDGGLYIAEDLHCSYWQDFDGGLFQPYSSLAFFKQLADTINHEHWGIDKTRTELLRSFNRQYNIRLDEVALAHIHSIEFINSMCVVCKAIPADNVLGRRLISGTVALVYEALMPLHGSSCSQPDQSINPWATKDAPVDEIANQLQKIVSLNQAASERDIKITGAIKTILAQNQNAFRKAFDAEWYVEKYPDVGASGMDPYQHYVEHGLTEGRLPSADAIIFIRDAFLEEAKELNHVRQIAETRLAELNEREKVFAEQLQHIQQTNEQRTNEQRREYAEREQIHVAQLAQARQQLEAQLRELLEREKAFAEQLQHIQQTHEQQTSEQRREYAEREQAHVAQLAQARQQLEAQLRELLEREKAFAGQLQHIQQTHEQQTNEQRREYAEREQIHVAQLAQAQQQLEAQLRELAEREKAFSEQLYYIQQAHEQQTNEQRREYVEREQVYIAQQAQARQQIEVQLIELVEREKAFAEQLQHIQQAYVQQTNEQLCEYTERERAFNTLLASKQEEQSRLTQDWLIAEQIQTQQINQLKDELNAICASYSWRWTAPLRNLARLLGGKAVDSDSVEDKKGTILSPRFDQRVSKGERLASNVIHPNKIKTVALNGPFGDDLTAKHNATTNTEQLNIPAMKNTYVANSVEELCSYYDEEFVHCAYHTLLGRSPDPKGLRYYLARVRSGISKVEILAQFRLSTEGKSHRVKIRGLDEAITRYKQLKIPFIGAILQLAGVKPVEGDVRQNLRVIENKLHALNIQIRQELAEKKHSLGLMQQQGALNQDDVAETETLVVAMGEDSTFTYPSVVEQQMYDPIGHRYQAALTEIRSRLKMPPSKFSSMLDGVKISIVMPVYKVPLHFLEKAIESVRYQTYANWELCIVDDGSNDIKLAEYLYDIARKDHRIKLEIATSNRGISGATNAAILMADGDFIAFLDNDDMLTHDALRWIASEIQSHPDVDLVYSDECKIDEHDVPVELFTKPDWSPCALFNCMYTGHLSAYRKSIVEQVGCMRSEYDFSQDYDLALRVSEITSKVHHVARVLYGWRMISGSGAQGDKPYARITNIAALQDAAERREILGKAVAEHAANHLRVSRVSMSQKVSIVIPSDNLKNIQNTIDSIETNTLYQNYEIIVVTNSVLIKDLKKELSSKILLVPFDQEFNFSTKCNIGAKQASGDIIVFYNDDVRVVSKDWIEMILECFVHPGVGIVGPKLLYENYLIQHAGMVTGVRGLVGTAFHCLPHETTKHFGSALWMREVSLICGACLAIRKNIFELVNGFDDKNAPISHSDVDLCFRVRDAGFTCIYTPHATLIHIGHMSIGETEKEEALKPVVRKKDKSDIFLLRRWGHHTSYDPYFPPTMRDILYHDSPEVWQLYADIPPVPVGGKDVLLISHDLSGSGAPRIVYEMARILRDSGHFVVVASPVDGVYREKLNVIGVPVIIDELILRQHPTLERFARNFDLVIANTVVTWPIIKQLSEVVETYWYIHEMSLLQHLLNIQPEIKDIFSLAKGVWVGSKHAAELVLPHRPDAFILKYGVIPLNGGKDVLATDRLPLTVSLFGSYEPRKGQDLAIAAFADLPAEYRSKLRLKLFGRVLDENLYHAVEFAARGLHEVTVKTEIPYEQYIEELLASHAVLVASRDDTLPFVSIDALGAGKVLMCTNTTGTSSYIEHGISGFISSSPEPHAIAEMLRELVDRASELPVVGLNGRKIFDAQFSVTVFTSALLNACGIANNTH
jgi:GT2 family glycosyltransferase/chemotaxis protein histidine kinase CheA